MHPAMDLGSSVPAFLGKLWKLVEDPETDDLICWSPNGRSFFIRDQARFARELLPHYYKHNNMASFVRQLNMYGFHKIVSVELGGLKCDKDEMEFAHQCFVKDHPCLLDNIKRKIASNRDTTHPPYKPELMNKMLSEVRSMRGRQEQLDTRLGTMKRENEALWRELAILRQKHLKQQQIVNKLIHFLVTLVQPSRSGGLSVKRRYPLMIDDTRRQHKHHNKISKVQTSPKGPVIHELECTEQDPESHYIVAEMLENQEDPTIESPEHQSSAALDDVAESISYEEDALTNDFEMVQPPPQHQENITKKKHVKGKKKRKNNLPIKILIPTSKDAEEAREENIVFKVETDAGAATVETMKPRMSVPLATVRSSKLAAMAANLNKNSSESNNESDIDFGLDVSSSDDVSKDYSDLVKLGDILVVPPKKDLSQAAIADNSGTDLVLGDDKLQLVGDEIEGFELPEGQVLPSQLERSAAAENEKTDAGAGASTSAGSKDLTLSCINTSAVNDPVYREEMDNHLESVQSELENLREVLRNNLDANALLGNNLQFFGSDDPMSFGIPLEPDLDPRSYDKEEDFSSDLVNGLGGGKLIAYNSNNSNNLILPDLDRDMLMTPPMTSATPPVTEFNADYSLVDSLDKDDDNKSSFLNSLISLEDTSPKPDE